MSEVTFQKYIERRPNYHWQQVSFSPLHRNTFVVARYQLVRDLLKGHLANTSVLDVGCGTGTLAHYLSQQKARITGIDTSPEAIKCAQKKLPHNPNCAFQVAPAYQIPFPNQSFDHIIATEVIEHVQHPDKLLVEIKRVWNGRGHIIITTPIKLTHTPLDTMHVKEYFPQELEQLLKQHFPKIKIIQSHPVFWRELRRKRALGIAAGQYF